MRTFASIFSGLGGADLGAISAGYTPIWAIEKDPRLAKVYTANFSHRPWVGDFLETAPQAFAPPDLLWISPPCVRASSVNPQRGESTLDLSLAAKICEFASVLHPPQVILENVEGYKRFKSFEAIVERLFALGYWANWQVLDAADFGVPQNRRRLILRAVRGGFLPELPQRRLHQGWAEVVRLEDCIQKLLPQRAIESLPVYPSSRPHLFYCSGKRSQLRAGVLPSFTLTRVMCGSIALNPAIVSDSIPKNEGLFLGIRNLARIQGFPDSYQFSGVPYCDGTGIGNAVPPAMAAGCISSFA
jgi:DNA (cytosine-5)-methyltransferase 1